jgi:integrase
MSRTGEPRDEAVLRLLLDTGVGVSELRGLTPTDVDPDRGGIRPCEGEAARGDGDLALGSPAMVFVLQHW